MQQIDIGLRHAEREPEPILIPEPNNSLSSNLNDRAHETSIGCSHVVRCGGNAKGMTPRKRISALLQN
jgi:hypothetical protein